LKNRKGEARSLQDRADEAFSAKDGGRADGPYCVAARIKILDWMGTLVMVACFGVV